MYLQIPILADVTKAVSARYGVLKRDAGIALRGLYIINPEARGAHAVCIAFSSTCAAALWMTWGAACGDKQLAPTCCPPPGVLECATVQHVPRLSSLCLNCAPHMHCCASQGVLEHITVNNFPIGRNVDEALRTLQARCAC